ncbi:zinc ribbon domain-containing protein [Chroococcidiopsis sp. CCMEE 29]|uniref:zinc ribbon domain-containing protein n=1 Tax=Chroococcidiopsis sp. CCMEE 29 TaxID=155894 RepID=UPI0020214288|nr:zinc ribbon domain-containing protein [Chroococcidiopsis sp. CCMEE 29]
MTAYRCELRRGQQIYLENQGRQTVITLVSTGVGQQQSQCHSFDTGKWRVMPIVFRTAAGGVIQVEGEGRHFVQVQAQGMSVLNVSPPLSGAQTLPLEAVETAAGINSGSTIPPIEPMKMGNMQMSMNPMEMRMGNMEMRMGEPLKMGKPSEQTHSAKNFCPQCGSRVEAGDRFCSHCGNRLSNEN